MHAIARKHISTCIPLLENVAFQKTCIPSLEKEKQLMNVLPESIQLGKKTEQDTHTYTNTDEMLHLFFYFLDM